MLKLVRDSAESVRQRTRTRVRALRVRRGSDTCARDRASAARRKPSPPHHLAGDGGLRPEPRHARPLPRGPAAKTHRNAGLGLICLFFSDASEISRKD